MVCATCGVEVFGGDAHHFDAADRSIVWHVGCPAPAPEQPKRKPKPTAKG